MMRPAPSLLWVFALGILPMGLAAAVWPGFTPLVWLAAAGLAVLCCFDYALAQRQLQGLEAKPGDEGQLAQGREGIISIRLRKPAARSVDLDAGLALPPSFECAEELQRVSLQPGAEEYSVTWRCTPHERGRFHLDAFYAWIRSPLRLLECGAALPLELPLQVFPDAGRYGSLLARMRGQTGLRTRRQLGKGREFEKLREYSPGDGMDEIHWKATARHGKPITKVFQTERMQEIYAVIDISRLMARRFGDSSALDEYLRVALLLGTAAEQQGDRFGVILFHREVSQFIRARNGKAHYAACRRAIFDAQPQPVPADFFELASFLRIRVPKRSLLFLLTALDEPSAAASLLKAGTLLARRHLPIVAMLQPHGVEPVLASPVSSEPELYAALAGHLQWRSLRELDISLRQSGIRFALVKPGALAGSVLSLYDEVKQRQLL